MIENFQLIKGKSLFPDSKFYKLEKSNLDPIRKDVVTGKLILVAITLFPHKNNGQIPDNYWNIELFTVIRDHYNKWCLINTA